MNEPQTSLLLLLLLGQGHPTLLCGLHVTRVTSRSDNLFGNCSYIHERLGCRSLLHKNCSVTECNMSHYSKGSEKPPLPKDRLRLYSMRFCPFAQVSERIRLKSNIACCYIFGWDKLGIEYPETHSFADCTIVYK